MSVDELRDSAMMSHLLDGLAAGQDIGHYGRLAFAMIARHFVDRDELVQLLAQGGDTDEAKARVLVEQVEDHDYTPPRRERIMEWQSHQAFPICPTPEDPDSCNVYRELRFPDTVYDHISDHQAETHKIRNE